MTWFYGLGAVLLSVLCTYVVRRLAFRWSVLDFPNEERKKHAKPLPLLGGFAIFASFWLVVGLGYVFHPVKGLELLFGKLVAVFLGSCLLMIIGAIDDKRGLMPSVRLFLSMLAVIVAIAGGVGVEKITNPLGGTIMLSDWAVSLGGLGHWLVVADTLVFMWLMGMMYTSKITDGLDGLSTGVVAIGSLMIYGLTQTALFYQPNVGFLALVFAGSCVGFLAFNFSPASIFLGEGGSLFLGYMLGVLSVISGGKLATAALVMAVPIIDLARVMYLRYREGKPLSKGDRKHLHFVLSDRGIPVPAVVLLFYAAAGVSGLAALFLQSIGKVLLLGGLFIAMFVVGAFVQVKNPNTP